MKKRILSIFVALALSLSLLPVTAFAEEGSPYGVYVNGIPVTDSNKGDILGEADSGATATYDSAAKTLTLNNSAAVIFVLRLKMALLLT